MGKTIDVLAIVATIFGVATSLIYLTILSTKLSLLFTSSAFVGIERVMKVLSNINILLAVLLMTLVVILGPTAQIFNVFPNTLGSYMDQFLYTSLRIKPFGDNSCTSNWTLFNQTSQQVTINRKKMLYE